MDDLNLLSLSQVRHDLQLFPKRFETNPYPVLIEQHGKPVMALLPIELYAVMEGAMDYIEEKGLQSFFENWLEQENQALELENALETAEDTPDDTDIPEDDLLGVFRQDGMLESPEFRAMLKERFTKTLAELEALEIQMTYTP